MALAHAKARGAAEALLAEHRRQLCEGTGSNVFVVLDGELVTPPLSSGCLAGVTRALVLEWTGAVERDVPPTALLGADEVFLTSSTRDVQGVHAVGDDEYAAAPGPVTRRGRGRLRRARGRGHRPLRGRSRRCSPMAMFTGTAPSTRGVRHGDLAARDRAGARACAAAGLLGGAACGGRRRHRGAEGGRPGRR